MRGYMVKYENTLKIRGTLKVPRKYGKLEKINKFMKNMEKLEEN